MQIKKVDSGLLHSCMYIVEERGHALVVDPCEDISDSERLIIDYLLATHEHYDHISGVNKWKEYCRAPLICSEACAKNIRDPRKNMSRYFDVFCQMQTWMPLTGMDISPVEYACEADVTFKDLFLMEWQGHRIRLMEIPGHSPGSIIIDIDGTDFFTGDSLLKDSETELRFPGGSKRKWEETGRKRIEAIPETARIWPGHFERFVKKDRLK